MLQEVRADVLSNAEIKSVIKEGNNISVIELVRGEFYKAK